MRAPAGVAISFAFLVAAHAGRAAERKLFVADERLAGPLAVGVQNADQSPGRFCWRDQTGIDGGVVAAGTWGARDALKIGSRASERREENILVAVNENAPQYRPRTAVQPKRER